MAYSIYKIISLKFDINHEGFLDGEFVLDDSKNKKICKCGKIPNNDKDANTYILSRAEELFVNGEPYKEDVINVKYEKESNLDVKKFNTEIEKASDIESIKSALKILVKPVSIGAISNVDI